MVTVLLEMGMGGSPFSPPWPFSRMAIVAWPKRWMDVPPKGKKFAKIEDMFPSQRTVFQSLASEIKINKSRDVFRIKLI